MVYLQEGTIKLPRIKLPESNEREREREREREAPMINLCSSFDTRQRSPPNFA
jgi:hypothetical protein